jgi:peptide/nickel transport system substrate-binding protein
MKRLALASVTCGAIVALAACGSSSKSSSSGSSTSSGGLKPLTSAAGESLTGGKKGGTLLAYQHEDFQHLDPGQSYFALDYPLIYATQTPLYVFLPNNAQQTVPLLASGPATISAGGKTVTVHIRHGFHFSPPVNREVTSADVAYAIERGANPNVANPYFPSYFNYIVGADKATGGPIKGIVTPDKYTIVFHLTGTYGSFFTGALSMPLTAPVPKEFAAPLDAKKPTAFGIGSLVATGPYMVAADKTGKVTGYQTGKSATLIRNPKWSSSSGDPRPAYLDQINYQIGGDTNVISRQALSGTHAVDMDSPSRAVVASAYKNNYNQILGSPNSGDYYAALNNHYGPFANVNVRRALWAILNREELIKLGGGSIIGIPGSHFIYPGTNGYTQAGGDAGPQVDYNKSLTGDPAVAAKYMKLAGFPSGKYTGGAIVKVVGSTGDPASNWAQAINHAVQQLGFKTNLTIVDQPVMYQKYCGDPKQKIDVCPNVGWIRDWSDPQTVLEPTFGGFNTVPTNNSNWGLVSWQDWPKSQGGTYTSGPLTPLDKAMKAAEAVVGDTARAQAWANVDKMLVDQAVAVPWDFITQPYVMSKDIVPVNQQWNEGEFDLSYTSLK